MVSLSNHERIGAASFDKLRMSRAGEIANFAIVLLVTQAPCQSP